MADTQSNLTIRTDLSLLYRVLRTVIKPLRPNLVKPGKAQPAGSPKLKAPKSKNGCSIHEIQQSEVKVWTYTFVPEGETLIDPFAHQVETKPTRHQVLYFAGGGFQSPPSGEHWGFVSWLARDLRKTHQFTIVSYPLAPNSPACDSLPICRRFLKDVMQRLGSSGMVTLMGDSAGGNLALSLGLWWVEQLEQAQKDGDAFHWRYEIQQAKVDDRGNSGVGSLVRVDDFAVLDHIVAISPAVDMRNINPDIETINKHDPVLTKELTSSVAEAWCLAPRSSGSKPTPGSNPKSIDPGNASVSPLLAAETSFSALKAQNVRVSGLYGTYDVLSPDTDLMRRKLVEHGVAGRWLKWEGQMHCFPLASVYGLTEGKHGRNFVVEVMRDKHIKQPAGA